MPIIVLTAQGASRSQGFDDTAGELFPAVVSMVSMNDQINQIATAQIRFNSKNTRTTLPQFQIRQAVAGLEIL